jgi:3-hydroxyacyl-CoA dehydrogenase
MAIKTVGVVGTGVIGASWTGLFLAHGLRVLVADPSPDAADKLASYLKSIWPALQEIGLSEGASIDNYEFVGASLGEHYSKVDFIQEVCIMHCKHSQHIKLTLRQNAPERPELKLKLLAEIDAKTRKDVVIASSSSGIPSSRFISQCKNPERVLIGHPFNPPHLMPLVEVVPHPGTNAATIATAIEFYNSIGRKAIHIQQEAPGFVANRLQAALLTEAYSLVSRGIISAEDLGKSQKTIVKTTRPSTNNVSLRLLCNNQSRPALGVRRALPSQRPGRRRRQQRQRRFQAFPRAPRSRHQGLDRGHASQRFLLESREPGQADDKRTRGLCWQGFGRARNTT